MKRVRVPDLYKLSAVYRWAPGADPAPVPRTRHGNPTFMKKQRLKSIKKMTWPVTRFQAPDLDATY